MTSRILADAVNGNAERKKWANRIANREHHKMIFETGLNLNASGLNHFKTLTTNIKGRFNTLDFLEDISKATIHKILTPDDQEDTGLVRLCLKVSTGTYREIGDESQIFQKIPRRFQQGRIFVDLKDQPEELRREVETYATTEWRNLGGN